MPVLLTQQEKDFLSAELEQFKQSFLNNEIQPVAQAFGFGNTPPYAINDFNNKLITLQNALHSGPRSGNSYILDEVHFTMIKLVLFARRRVKTASVDERKAKTTNPEINTLLDAELLPYDNLLTKEWLQNVGPERMPRLSDYLTLEAVQQLFAQRHLELKPRQFDEKFHTLQAPTLLVFDIAYYRDVNSARGNPVAVAYLDIDDFKNLNSRYGHSTVDAHVLPVFMRKLESFTFGRGYAYRYGGDEYAILLTNGQGADRALQNLQEQLRELSYYGVEEKLSISIGLCEVTPESFLSDRAVVDKANAAMLYAKTQGKNRIATFKKGSLYETEDLVVIPQLNE